jgi:hypothetical protein
VVARTAGAGSHVETHRGVALEHSSNRVHSVASYLFKLVLRVEHFCIYLLLSLLDCLACSSRQPVPLQHIPVVLTWLVALPCQPLGRVARISRQPVHRSPFGKWVVCTCLTLETLLPHGIFGQGFHCGQVSSDRVVVLAGVASAPGPVADVVVESLVVVVALRSALAKSAHCRVCRSAKFLAAAAIAAGPVAAVEQ